MSIGNETIHLPDIVNEAYAVEMREQVQQLLQSGKVNILLDLTDTKFIDSSGLGVLALTYKSVKAAGGRLCFCSVGTQPSMLFELTGMEEIFEIFPNKHAYMEAIMAS